MHIYEFKIKERKQLTIRNYLKKIGISSTVIKMLTKERGLIKVNNITKFTTDYVQYGDIITLHYKETKENNISPIKFSLNILYEDEYYIVVDKPSGTATIPSYCNYQNSLANYITYYMQGNGNKDFIYRAINRLDKDTSGIVIICKDAIAYDFLLRYGKIKKEYKAICYGKVKQRIIKSKIETTKTDGKNDIKRIVSSNGKYCYTKIFKKKYNKKTNTTICYIRLKTGRTHQIRVHLSSIGHPLIGDKIYSNNLDESQSLQLICYKTTFYNKLKNIKVKINV